MTDERTHQGCKKSEKNMDRTGPDRTGPDLTSKTGPFFENLQNNTEVNKNTVNKAKTLTIRHKNMFSADKTSFRILASSKS